MILVQVLANCRNHSCLSVLSPPRLWWLTPSDIGPGCFVSVKGGISGWPIVPVLILQKILEPYLGASVQWKDIHDMMGIRGLLSVRV